MLYIQPAINNKPPTGVIGPKKRTFKCVKLVVDKRKILPEKKITPSVKNHHTIEPLDVIAGT